MRILHISKYAYPVRGGIETCVRDLSTEQVRQGHDITVLCHQPTPLKGTTTTLEDGVAITRCATLGTCAFAPLSPVFPLHLRTAIKRARPDVIHLHLPNPAVLYSRIFPANVPVIAHWHADVQGTPSAAVRALYPLYRLFETPCLSRASRIVTTSPPYRQSSPSLRRWHTKTAVIPLGIDLNRYPAHDTVEQPDRPLVLSVGRCSFYKGFEHLVRAAAAVPEADFVIAGDGSRRWDLLREIDRLALSDRVHLPGAVSDSQLRQYYKQASLFCLPSVDRSEAFGVVLLEAMRYGLPLISTAIPGSGAAWVNMDGHTGIVVPPASPSALAQAIKDMLHNTQRTEEMGKAARARLEETFTIQAVAQSFQALYREVIANPTA
ncbi:glycosyltransferase [Pseudodesulfovibrio sediminis]|uniref:glycosyltransferase n=1 Tax=Pseudodesulfovibrio sediminis TaxID=2810563 RepID=UPI001E2E2DD9|nr:glycosyltransferase [Pseudodesulfovibrio sediminis]